MYKIGDKVVYPMHGAGEIVDVVEKEILGNVKNYFLFKMPVGNMDVMLPVDSIDTIGIRNIISNKEMDTMLSALCDMECVENINWNKRYRENMEKLKTGSVTEVADVIKALMLREKEKGLSTGERKMLSTAKQILISEIMLIKTISFDEANQLVNESIA